MRQSLKSALVWCVMGATIVGVYHYTAGPSRGDNERITFSKLLDEIQHNPQHIKKLTIKGERWVGDYADGHKFRTIGPPTVDGELLAKLTKDGKPIVPYEFEEREENSLLTLILGSWLPILALGFIFFLFMRQLQAGGGKAMSFGKSRHRLLGDAQPRVTFADVAGIEEAKHEVEEIIAFLKDPKKFTKLGGRIPKGVLLMGPPGTGKTLLARAIAGEANVAFFSISGSDFVEMFVGVGASRVRDLFEQGKKNAPCIIFIDEIDAVGRHRGAGLGGGHDEREQTLNQLLVEMDGFESNDGVILVAATNRPDVLDPALLRPGRFDRRIIVSRPDVKGREGILKVHARKVPLAGEVALEVIAKATPGFSGADLESLVNEAALLAARRDKEKVDMRDFEEAKDKVLMGPERKSMVISDKEKRTTAYHEAGHALLAKLLKAGDPVHKVTIIPRGPTLGSTHTLPDEDRLSLSKEWAESTISMLMGGRIAEELMFGQLTTGAGNDIERATELARHMVCDWGMSDKMGPLTFGKKEEQVFLGHQMGSRQNYSEETARTIDEEIKRIVHEGYQRARTLLETHLEQLKLIAEALLELEMIDASEVEMLMAGKKIERKLPPPPAPKVADAKAAPEKKSPPPLFGAALPEPEKA